MGDETVTPISRQEDAVDKGSRTRACETNLLHVTVLYLI